MSDNQGMEDYKWAVKEIQLGMKIFGVYFNNNLPKWQQTLITSRATLYVIIVFNFITLPSIPALIKVWGDLSLVIDNLIVSVPFTLSICHFITAWHNKAGIIELFHMMKIDWIAQKSSFERNLMIKNSKITIYVTRSAYIFVLWVIAMHNLPFWLFGIVPRTHTNLTDGDQPLIAQTSYIYDTTVNVNFILTAIGQTMCSVIVGTTYSTIGSIFFTSILHACTQLQILKMRLETIFDNHENKLNVNDKNISKFIGKMVRQHQRLIKLVETVENVFHLMFLQQFIGITLALSTEEFLMISILVGDVEVPLSGIIFTIIYTIYCGSMTLMYCTCGELLIERSTAIQLAAYNSLWYNSKRTYRTELTMIINRAQKPLFITAGKFVPISLSTFASLVKTSASYMSVLLAVKS